MKLGELIRKEPETGQLNAAIRNSIDFSLSSEAPPTPVDDTSKSNKDLLGQRIEQPEGCYGLGPKPASHAPAKP